jgi:hypothetical protein
VNQRILPMLGFKRFDDAEVTITGIELAVKIKKDIQDGQARRAQSDDDGTVERRTRSLSPIRVR